MLIFKWLKRLPILILLSLPLFAIGQTQFRIIIDASGSMQNTDPEKMTATAIQMFADLVPNKDASLGVWLFGETPRELLPETVMSESFRRQVAQYTSAYVTSDVKTDLESIVKLLLESPQSNSDEDVEKHWILITDGMVDISPDDLENLASRKRLETQWLRDLQKQKVHLHTISLTGYTDKALLERLSYGTNATHTEIAFPSDLLPTLNNINRIVYPMNELPIESDRFFIDPSVSSVIAILFPRDEETIQLRQPNGRLYSLNNAGIPSGKSNDYRIVRLQTPALGTWEILGSDLDTAKVLVESRVQLHVSTLPPVVFINENLISDLSLQTLTSSQASDSVSAKISLRQTLSKLNGELSQTLVEKQTDFSQSNVTLSYEGISTAGSYELLSVVDGAVYTRQTSQLVTAIAPITLSVDHSNSDRSLFTIQPTHSRLNRLRSEVQLEMNYINGQKREQVSLLPQGFWQKVVQSDDNLVSVRALLNGVLENGERLQYATPLQSAQASPIISDLVEGEGATSSIAPKIVFSEETKAGVFAAEKMTVSTQDDLNNQANISKDISQPVGELVKKGTALLKSTTQALEQFQSDVAHDAQSARQSRGIVYLLGGLGGLFIVGILLGVFWRKRRRNQA